MYDSSSKVSETTSQKPLETWESEKEATKESSFPLKRSGKAWKARGLAEDVEQKPKVQFEGGSSKRDEAVSGVAVSWDQVAALKPGQAIGSNGLTTLAAFHDKICSRK